LEQIGLERERVRMFNLSSAMAGHFAQAAAEMAEQIAALGPNPLRNEDRRRGMTGQSDRRD
jgi:F420-non-reducing hydrogenase iron-sulfur subunit